MSDEEKGFNEARMKHLEMIQGIISRLSSHSIVVKGWSVTLVAALFALAADKADVNFVLLAYFPVALFWALDGFFLWEEKRFREVYDHVRGRSEEVDFAMKERPGSTNTFLGAVWSKTLVLFHGTTLGSVVVVMLILK